MPASLDDVRRLAADYNLIPLTRTLLADLHTPVGAYLSAVRGRRARYAYLLESVEGGERLGRYSFLGLDPDFLLRQRRGRVARGDGRSWTPVPGSLLDLARAEVRRRRIAPALAASAADAASDGAAPPPPFLAGAVGYLAYDM